MHHSKDLFKIDKVDIETPPPLSPFMQQQLLRAHNLSSNLIRRPISSQSDGAGKSAHRTEKNPLFHCSNERPWCE